MKRPNKCVNKKAYAYRSDALEVAKRMYLQSRTKTAIYECPSCLDFHLTSKRCNTYQYHDKWTKEGFTTKKKRRKKSNKKRQQLADRRLKKELNRMYQEFLWLERRTLENYGLAPLKIKLTGTKKENTLPLAEQRRIIAELDKKRLSTPPRFSSFILDIIKGVGNRGVR